MDRHRRGQILVLVALALFVLVAFVALAVDIGHIYRERRHMQNAADAGALAGAREICHGEPSQAEARAREYAVDRNGAQGAEITISGGVTVTVVTTETVQTFFAGLMGFNEVPVAADATAICGKAAAAEGLWPVAFDKRRWEDAESKGHIQCGQKIIIWQESGRVNCEPGTGYNCCVLFDKHGAILEFLDCEEGWQPEIYPLDWQTWVDFSGGLSGNDPCDSRGCGAEELRDRIALKTEQGESCESFVALPDCFAVPQGVKSSAWHAAEDEELAGQPVKIPLYDPCQSGKGEGSTDILDPENCSPTDTVCTMDKDPGSNCTNERYLIEKMVCLQLGWPVDDSGTKWHPPAAYLAPFDEDEKVTPGELIKVLIATIPCDDEGNPLTECGSASGWTTGEAPKPGDVPAVSLIE